MMGMDVVDNGKTIPPALAPEIARLAEPAQHAAGAAVVAGTALCNNFVHTTGRSAMNPHDQPCVTSLEELVARIVERDQAALAELYDATAGRVYALALHIVGDRASAEEVVSDTYYQVWKQADRYDIRRGRTLAWMLTICRSRALDKLRRRDTADVHPDPTGLHAEPVSEERGPLDILLVNESSSLIHAALADLDAQSRRLLSLAFFKGYTHQEIARHTGIPLGSVKSVIRRSMQSLRSVLEHAGCTAKESSDE